MKKVLLIVGILAFLATLWAGIFYWNNLRGIGPVIKPPPHDITQLLNTVNVTSVDGSITEDNKNSSPLVVPDGFEISIFAKDVDGARVIVPDALGYLWVSQTKQGIITRLAIEYDQVTEQTIMFKGLNRPHGMAFDPDDPNVLYIAEEDKISRVQLYAAGLPMEKIIDLPLGGRHTTRTIAFGPDGRLYVSIGSSCDVCDEDDPRRAALYSMNKDGADVTVHATGLRNAVFFDWNSVDGSLWATEMGRDRLGDDLPPDEINIIIEGGNYGWPMCYGKNVHDSSFDTNTYISNPCAVPFVQPSYIDLPAHVAPLGFAFIPEEGWPEDYWYDLIVAYHGSWNRSEPVGYSLERLKFDANGQFEGSEEFIYGWLTSDYEALGRPVDIYIEPDGTMYVSDDKAGVIYRVRYASDVEQSTTSRITDQGHNDMFGSVNIVDDTVITSPLIIEGSVRGYWFFEGEFNFELLDAHYQSIGIGIAKRQQVEWMTDNYVSFKGVLDYERPSSDTGFLKLQKSNPSDFRHLDDSLTIPIRFR